MTLVFRLYVKNSFFCCCWEHSVSQIYLVITCMIHQSALKHYWKRTDTFLGKKKNMRVNQPVNRPSFMAPTLNFFYGALSRKLFKKNPIFAFQCSFWCLRDHYYQYDKNELKCLSSSVEMHPTSIQLWKMKLQKNYFRPTLIFSACDSKHTYLFFCLIRRNFEIEAKEKIKM